MKRCGPHTKQYNLINVEILKKSLSFFEEMMVPQLPIKDISEKHFELFVSAFFEFYFFKILFTFWQFIFDNYLLYFYVIPSCTFDTGINPLS